jgi:hypothetical protein
VRRGRRSCCGRLPARPGHDLVRRAGARLARARRGHVPARMAHLRRARDQRPAEGSRPRRRCPPQRDVCSLQRSRRRRDSLGDLDLCREQPGSGEFVPACLGQRPVDRGGCAGSVAPGQQQESPFQAEAVRRSRLPWLRPPRHHRDHPSEGGSRRSRTVRARTVTATSAAQEASSSSSARATRRPSSRTNRVPNGEDLPGHRPSCSTVKIRSLRPVCRAWRAGCIPPQPATAGFRHCVICGQP